MKKFLALALCLSVMSIATACGSGDESAEVPEDAQVQEEVTESVDETMDETVDETDAEAETESETDVDADAEAVETSFTGILEEKKDFMVVVSNEDQTESYTFNLADGVQCDAEVGEKITVTFTGDIDAPVADQDLTATEIVIAE